jgi:hypothetical protein
MAFQTFGDDREPSFGNLGTTEATRSTQAKLQAYKEAKTIHKKKAQGSLGYKKH